MEAFLDFRVGQQQGLHEVIGRCRRAQAGHVRADLAADAADAVAKHAAEFRPAIHTLATRGVAGLHGEVGQLLELRGRELVGGKGGDVRELRECGNERRLGRAALARGAQTGGGGMGRQGDGLADERGELLGRALCGEHAAPEVERLSLRLRLGDFVQREAGELPGLE